VTIHGLHEGHELCGFHRIAHLDQILSAVDHW
jgi:hypothetical protein